MQHNDFAEYDTVRVTRALSGLNPYTGEENRVEQGALGVIIRGNPGDTEFDVEFTEFHSPEDWDTSILIIDPADLAPTKGKGR